MKTNESIAVATVSLFKEVDLSFPANPFWARQIFVPVCKKALARSNSYALRAFYKHSLKI